VQPPIWCLAEVNARDDRALSGEDFVEKTLKIETTSVTLRRRRRSIVAVEVIVPPSD
jgi:hypothetical protein